jgi:peptide/nickel transport system substrate-binding protein
MKNRSTGSSRNRVFTAGLLSMAFVAAACGGSSKSSSSPTTAAGTAATTAAATATSEAPATTAPKPVETTAQTAITTAATPATTVAAGERPVLGGTLRVALESAVSTLDPAQQLAQPADKIIALSIFDPLVAFDKDNKFVPFLAESVTAADDLKSWTVVLRKGIKFQDGTDLNADAVVKHWLRMADPATGSPWATSAGQQKPSKKDDSTVVFTMDSPNIGFINDLTTAMGFIPSPTAVAKDPAGFGLAPVGTGPFKVTKFEPGGVVEVEKNAAYWRKDDAGGALPYLDKITFTGIADTQKRLQALQNGEFDLINTADTSTVVAAEKAKLKVQRVSGSSSTNLLFNNQKAPLDSPLVRQAIAYATDKDSINTLVYDGARIPSYSIFALDSPYLNKNATTPKFDLEKAKALVKEYGKPIEITAECIPSPEANNFMDLLKQQWEAAGMKVTLKSQDQGAYVARIFGKVGDYQVACFRTNQFAEPDQVRSGYVTNDKTNLSFYSNPEVDKLFDEGKASADFAKRKAAYDQIQVLLIKDLPGITLMYDLAGNITSPNVFGLPNPEASALGAIKLAGVFIKK